MSFPNNARDVLGANFHVTKAIDAHCLTVYSSEEWDKLAAKVAGLPAASGAKLRRFLFAGATELIPDKQGRVLIPQSLRQYANLEKDVIVIGSGSTAEIWNKADWDAFNDSCDPEDLMNTLTGLDF